MTLLSRFRAVRNLNSGQIFVLLDDSPDQKITVINPKGNTLTVPAGLFEESFSVGMDRCAEYLTDLQVQALQKTSSMGRRRAQSSATGTSRTRLTKSRSKVKTTPKHGIGAEWSCDKLTFYKHKIEPLSETESFKIHLDRTGVFQISKAVFQRLFNDVVMSTDYWKEGAFSYQELPEKARSFISPV
ncbi:MAG: hypothetical protein H6618_03660 [Deltaproteobacteria bacterium]|nr:hypothetical protein [Deltaproteobacteria bacterium]